jgi:hypothetical protein
VKLLENGMEKKYPFVIYSKKKKKGYLIISSNLMVLGHKCVLVELIQVWSFARWTSLQERKELKVFARKELQC